jgi:hypothetical protein
VRLRGREVDGWWLIERVVDLAAVEEGVDHPSAGCWLIVPEAGRVPEPRQHHLVAVRQIRKELLTAICGGVEKSRSPPMRRVSTSDQHRA